MTIGLPWLDTPFTYDPRGRASATTASNTCRTAGKRLNMTFRATRQTDGTYTVVCVDGI
jgi:hypothetical protein